MRVSFDYPGLSYEIIIPSRGEFPANGKGWGPSPISIPATLNCAAMLEIPGQGVDQLSIPTRYTTQTPAPHGLSLPIGQIAQSSSHASRISSAPRRKSSLPRRNQTTAASGRYSWDPYPVPIAVSTPDIGKQRRCQLCREKGVPCVRHLPMESCLVCHKWQSRCKCEVED